MKTFLTTLKGKIIAGAVTLLVVAAVVVTAIIMNSGYRTIVVDELNGITNIINNNKSSEAFSGQHLVSGDDVTVTSNSDLTLLLDADKYVYAEENTHFWIEAKGKLNNTRTDIFMDEGSNLFRIDNKLTEDEEFTVDTPNSTMSVRGTVFRVSLRTDANGDKYTLVEVFEGEVFVEVKYELGQITGESKLLHAGESVVIRSNTGFSEFVKDENGEVIQKIEYGLIPQMTARKLAVAMDAGRTLSITKELLYDYVALTDHVFDKKEIVKEATCSETGLYYDVCSVCGIISEEKIIPLLEHEYHEETVSDKNGEVYIIRKCSVCGETSPEDEGLVIDENGEITGKTSEADTDTADNEVSSVDEKESQIKRKADDCASGHHKYGAPYILVFSTENNPGLMGRVCSECMAIKEDEVVVIPQLKSEKAPETHYESSSEESHESRKDDDEDEEEHHHHSSSHTHNYIENAARSTPATCTNSGSSYQECSCGATRTVPLAMTSHTYAWVRNGDGTDPANPAGAVYPKYREECSDCHAVNPGGVGEHIDVSSGGADCIVCGVRHAL